MPINDWITPDVPLRVPGRNGDPTQLPLFRSPRDGFSATDAEIAKQPATTSRFTEVGTTGLSRWGQRSPVDEEFLNELRGIRGRKVYREMRENDSVVGAVLMAVEMLMRNVEWQVQGEDKGQVEFVESCMSDMSHTWEDFIGEVLSMLPYGWSWHEIVYKKRQGPGSDPKTRSRYTDGLIGWRKFPIRAQDTLIEWVWDEEGGVQAFVQSAPPNWATVEIPIDRSLLFRTGSHKGNPEGRSVLRSAFRPWWFKKRFEEIEGIGIERDLAGLPVFYVSKAVHDKYETTLKTILRNIRRDEQEGLYLPLVVDPDTKEKELQFELLGSPGKRQMDVSAAIERCDKRIAMAVLADFILMGQDKVGSYALSQDKTKLFTASMRSLLKSISSVVNRFAIPRLLAVNGMDLDSPPELTHGEIQVPDLKSLSEFIASAAGAGMPLFPDDELEGYLRKLATLPKKPEGLEAPPQPEPKPPSKPARKPPKPARKPVTEEPEEEGDV